MNIIETVKMWSFKKFAGKYIKQGIRLGVSFVLGRVGVSALSAYGVTVDTAALEAKLDYLVWSGLFLLSNVAKVKLAGTRLEPLTKVL